MYLFSVKHMVKQRLAPSWRNGVRDYFMQALAAPFASICGELYSFTHTVPELVNYSSQVMVLEHNLNRIAGFEVAKISISDSQENGIYVVNVPEGVALAPLIAHLHRVKVHGKRWQISQPTGGDFDHRDFDPRDFKTD